MRRLTRPALAAFKAAAAAALARPATRRATAGSLWSWLQIGRLPWCCGATAGVRLLVRRRCTAAEVHLRIFNIVSSWAEEEPNGLVVRIQQVESAFGPPATNVLTATGHLDLAYFTAVDPTIELMGRSVEAAAFSPCSETLCCEPQS